MKKGIRLFLIFFVMVATTVFGATSEKKEVMESFEGSFLSSDWATNELKIASEYGLISNELGGKDLKALITREEFVGVAVKVYETLSGKEYTPTSLSPFTDSKNIDVIKAYELGITLGTSQTTFSPDMLLNREQAVTMLTRAYKKATIVDWTVEKDSEYPLQYPANNLFADDDEISPWAKESVYFMCANGVINGVGENKFAPKSTPSIEKSEEYANATREQAIIIATRMIDTFSDKKDIVASEDSNESGEVVVEEVKSAPEKTSGGTGGGSSGGSAGGGTSQKKTEYSIQYHLDGGTVEGNPTKYSKTTANITLNNPAKEGFTFLGWTGTGLNVATEVVVIAKGSTGNREYTANWQPNSYTVKFNGNFPADEVTEGHMEDYVMTYDVPANLPENGYSVLGYRFIGWNTNADGTGDKIEDGEEVNNLVDSGKIVLYAQWEKAEAYAITYHFGEIEFYGDNYLNTQISLFGENTFDKDFDISFHIDEGTKNAEMDTVVSAMDESGHPYPGFVYRYSETDDFELAANTNEEVQYDGDFSSDVKEIHLSRVNQILYLNDEEIIDYTDLERRFEMPLAFGASLDGDGNPQRYFMGKISSVDVTVQCDVGEPFTLPVPELSDSPFLGWTGSNGDTLESNITIDRYHTEDMQYVAHFKTYKNIITFDPTGGTIEEEKRCFDEDIAIGELPIPQKGIGYIFDGWYTSKNGGEEIEESSILTGRATIYARWKTPVGLLKIDNQTVTLAENESQHITMSGLENLSEEYEITSSNATLVSFQEDEEGITVTGEAEGDAIITISGVTSHTIKTINVYVTNQPNLELFHVLSAPVKTYFDNVTIWNSSKENFLLNMRENFERYGCKLNSDSSVIYQSGSLLSDKSNYYDTKTNGKVKVYLCNENSDEKTLVEYTKSNKGLIYNLIPEKTYYWESDTDSSQNGYIKVMGERRLLDTGEIRNTRDLGGLPVDVNHDGVIDGTTKYERLFRGEKMRTHEENKAELENLGVTKEIALYSEDEQEDNVQLDNYSLNTIIHYEIDYDSDFDYYQMARNTLVETMQNVISGENIYFHCVYGVDRTGTLAYLLEGLLGVTDEARYEDYELSVFFGEVDRNRYFETDLKSDLRKFVYMKDLIETSEDVYDWFMKGSTDTEADEELIRQFRESMIQ